MRNTYDDVEEIGHVLVWVFCGIVLQECLLLFSASRSVLEDGKEEIVDLFDLC